MQGPRCQTENPSQVRCSLFVASVSQPARSPDLARFDGVWNALFEGARGVGNRTGDVRPCSLTFAKQQTVGGDLSA